MAEQETLHNGDPAWKPEAHGIWKRYCQDDDGFWLDHAAVNRARAGLEVIGSCRDCGGDLIVAPSQDPQKSGSSISWTDIVCQQCGKETAAPNLKRLHRSSLHNRMTSGWWTKRDRAIRAAHVMRSS